MPSRSSSGRSSQKDKSPARGPAGHSRKGSNGANEDLTENDGSRRDGTRRKSTNANTRFDDLLDENRPLQTDARSRVNEIRQEVADNRRQKKTNVVGSSDTSDSEEQESDRREAVINFSQDAPDSSQSGRPLQAVPPSPRGQRRRQPVTAATSSKRKATESNVDSSAEADAEEADDPASHKRASKKNKKKATGAEVTYKATSDGRKWTSKQRGTPTDVYDGLGAELKTYMNNYFAYKAVWGDEDIHTILSCLQQGEGLEALGWDFQTDQGLFHHLKGKMLAYRSTQQVKLLKAASEIAVKFLRDLSAGKEYLEGEDTRDSDDHSPILPNWAQVVKLVQTDEVVKTILSAILPGINVAAVWNPRTEQEIEAEAEHKFKMKLTQLALFLVRCEAWRLRSQYKVISGRVVERGKSRNWDGSTISGMLLSFSTSKTAVVDTSGDPVFFPIAERTVSRTRHDKFVDGDECGLDDMEFVDGELRMKETIAEG